jgi:hypothetical protein
MAAFTPPENIPGTHFCKRLSQPQGHSAAGRIMSMKNSSDTIGNRTLDLPACSAVPTDLTIMNSTFRPGTARSLWDKKNWGAQIFQKSRRYLKILSATKATWIKDHTENPRITGVSAKKLVATATWRPGCAPLDKMAYHSNTTPTINVS